VGRALGGGGARGGIHIGFLKLFQEATIPVHCVAGTSIGALIGAAYCLDSDARALERRLGDYLESEVFRKARFNLMAEASPQEKAGIFTRFATFIRKELILNLALTRPYLISRDRLRENLAFFLPDVRVEDTRIPFAAVAADLETGEPVVIREGPLLDAVYASCTFPGVVEAVRWQGRLLVDGGVIAQVPVEATRQLGAERVIAVNVDKCIGASVDGLSGIDLIFRADDIMGAELTRCQTREADLLIQPGIGDTRWYDFQRMPDYVPVGEEAARDRLAEIREAVRPRLRLPRLGPNRPPVRRAS
jgi:NTE family protein